MYVWGVNEGKSQKNMMVKPMSEVETSNLVICTAGTGHNKGGVTLWGIIPYYSQVTSSRMEHETREKNSGIDSVKN